MEFNTGMSLSVPTALLERAEAGPISDDEFVAVVRDSLPYAWEVVTEAVTAQRLSADGVGEHEVPPPGEAERGQLLRALASDAIRGGLQRHFGVVLAFQNCHKVAAFAPSLVDSDRYRAFTSPRGQLLNQSPQLRDC